MQDQTLSDNSLIPGLAQVKQGLSPGGCGCGGSCGGTCPQCIADAKNAGVISGQYVYVIGRIYPRYPNLGVEKEVAQVLGRGSGVGVSDEQALYNILRDSSYLYLAQEMCWVIAFD